MNDKLSSEDIEGLLEQVGGGGVKKAEDKINIKLSKEIVPESEVIGSRFKESPRENFSYRRFRDPIIKAENTGLPQFKKYYPRSLVLKKYVMLNESVKIPISK